MGYALRKKTMVVRWANRVLAGIVYVLLFLMGVSLGGNADLVARLSELGLRGVLIGLCCALGSALVAVWLHKTLLKNVD